MCVLMFEPTQSCPAIPAVERISHARAAKRDGLAVSAPTGQTSITLPDISELTLRSM